MIRLKRVYDKTAPEDGARFLVERLWPRGVTKASLRIDAWLKEAAPSDALRRWFAHDPAKWDEFRRRYRAELTDRPEAVKKIHAAAHRGTVTLIYSSRDAEHNNAVALKQYLDHPARGARRSSVRARMWRNMRHRVFCKPRCFNEFRNGRGASCATQVQRSRIVV